MKELDPKLLLCVVCQTWKHPRDFPPNGGKLVCTACAPRRPKQ